MDPISMGLTGAGLLGGLFGGKKGVSSGASGFAAMPEAVQQAYLKTYLPAILQNYNAGYQSIPMQRVQAPSSPFDSRAMYDLQQYSDALGGYFSPMGGQGQQVNPNTASPVNDSSSPVNDAYLESLKRLFGANFGNVGSRI